MNQEQADRVDAKIRELFNFDEYDGIDSVPNIEHLPYEDQRKLRAEFARNQDQPAWSDWAECLSNNLEFLADAIENDLSACGLINGAAHLAFDPLINERIQRQYEHFWDRVEANP